MAKEQEVSFTDREKTALEKIATQLCMTIEQAATYLLSSEIASRYKRGTGKPPAQVYPIKRHVDKEA